MPSTHVSCVGTVETHEGLEPVDDPALRARALGLPSRGGLCGGQSFVVRAPLRVYRVWDHARPASERGRWWSLARPEGPVERYRAQNAICPEWSALDRVTTCTLRPGARVVLGPGQSASCNGAVRYPASAVNQLYVPNEDGAMLVERCETAAPWP